MGLNQNKNDSFQDEVNNNESVFQGKSIRNLNYLYPNGHRMTNQMRWFKGSRDRGLKHDEAA